MVCPKCHSESLSQVPAEIRLYRNRPRTLSHPPLTPSPEVQVCLDCGWAEFAIPEAWLAAGWLPQHSEPANEHGTPRETAVFVPGRLAVVM